ncbi:MAG: alpha-amylase family glycosyl hydrolase, partial [Clostridia bacterium]|nr:alpha-amylase family glycosyl hydrolase [Clostridia bacterium]
MKNFKKMLAMLLVIAIVLTLAPVISAPQEAVAATSTFSWNNANIYFVMTDRFVNGNTANDNSYGRSPTDGGDGGKNIGTFHGGDLAGLTNKLNQGYFTNLGINAIWITAPYEQIHGWVGGGSAGDFKHYAYHGYYTLDYTKVDANMGTETDLRTFIDTAHSKGIRVLFDIVMNHAGYNTIKDMNEFGFGKWKSTPLSNSWAPGSGQNWHSYHDSIDYSNGATEWAKWWGPNWIRAGLPGYTAGGSDDLTKTLDNLPDFKTESTTVPGLPSFLTRKTDTRAVAISNYTARQYLVKWLSDWVRDYGVDGFRCDTAKHVEMAGWKDLKTAATTALQQWKAANPTKKIDDAPFWMTGEAWGHGTDRSNYYDNGFDSMINFSYQGAIGNGISNYSGIESTYAYYAGLTNANPLSYISSHDTSLFYNGDATRQKKAGTLLMLTPKAVQVFYGDENARAFGQQSSDPYQGTRSDMPWPGNTDVLAHWQKLGQFRNNHVAVGAGVHRQITSAPYTFSRVYGTTDKVVCVLGASGSTTVNVSSVFANGTTVRDFYTGATAVVNNGNATFTANTNGVILIEDAGSVVTPTPTPIVTPTPTPIGTPTPTPVVTPTPTPVVTPTPT